MFSWLFFWKAKAPKSLSGAVSSSIALAEKGVGKASDEIKAAEEMLTRATRRQEFFNLHNAISQEIHALTAKADELKDKFSDVL